MGRSDIAEKITNTLNEDWTESNIVYLFVQMRKLLEHSNLERSADFSILKFFCDWIVHTSKDHIDDATLLVIKELDQDIDRLSKRLDRSVHNNILRFTYLWHLEPQLVKLLEQESIPTQRFADKDDWVEFISVIGRVLEDQPILIGEKYDLNIKSIDYKPRNKGAEIKALFYRPRTLPGNKKATSFGFFFDFNIENSASLR